MGGIEKLLLRDSRVKELLTIREMEQGEASDFIIPYALQAHREEFRKPTIFYKSICEGKELVGFLILALDPDGSSVELRRIVVSRPGHGIGERAIEMLREFCRNDLGRERIWLDVFETNDRARHVYESCGFRRFGATEHEGRTLLLFHCSDAIRCAQCSTRHVGSAKTEQYFHTMLSATVVADGHNRVLPLMPHFVQPQHNPHDGRSDADRKQDCERNAAKRWLPAYSDQLRPFRPIFLGDDLYCCQPLCQLVRNLDTDFLFICKPSSHKRLYELIHDDFIHSTGWTRTRNHHRQIEQHRYRWMHGLPVRDSDDAVLGTWIEFTVRRHGERTYYNTFFTSLEVTAENVAAIARLGRARWKIENETFNCLARHGYNLKRNFGHGSNGLANLLATLNLLAFTLHTLLDCLRGLWRQCRDDAGTRRNFFNDLRCLSQRYWFPNWTSLLTEMLADHAPRAGPGLTLP